MFTTDPWYKRLLKYSILLSIKEGYLFLRNWLGLVFHPFKTLRALFRERDWSQIGLVIGFPVYAFVGGLGIIWAARRFVQAEPGVWGFWTKGGVSMVTMVALCTFLYLGYWVWRVVRK